MALRVEIAYSPEARVVDRVELSLAEPCTVGEALRQSGLLQRHPEIDLDRPRVGVWGRPRRIDEMLSDGDRVEVYRALQVDPKEARRQRQRRQSGRAPKRGAGTAER
ncbi:RnfH family protein [uncultured Methylibium sp.]|uniref:RnfH family protein n=1 Tax=uncultured Methylibium sp. TaxID=381093 RepID=UPI0025F9B262|nr:RnfH family protein [uncultured Methylibium sp.]